MLRGRPARLCGRTHDDLDGAPTTPNHTFAEARRGWLPCRKSLEATIKGGVAGRGPAIWARRASRRRSRLSKAELAGLIHAPGLAARRLQRFRGAGYQQEL